MYYTGLSIVSANSVIHNSLFTIAFLPICEISYIHCFNDLPKPNCYMGDLQIKKQAKKYDAVIVGSGAGGGMAAYVLSKAGLKVCLLEAGVDYDPAKDSAQLKNPWESPRRGASTKFRPFGDFDGCYWGWEIDGEPIPWPKAAPNGIGGAHV
jgi:hypothetical protein